MTKKAVIEQNREELKHPLNPFCQNIDTKKYKNPTFEGLTCQIFIYMI
jgi:hypothetical protein